MSYKVRVMLSHATGLAASDLNGKSDPYVTFDVDGETARSSCRPKTCDPRWSPVEHFEFTVVNPQEKLLRVQVYDHDLITKDDLLGETEIPLKQHMDPDDDATRAFTLQVPSEFAKQEVYSKLFLSIRVIPESDADLVLELWENESWIVGKGWGSGDSTLFSHRAKWSTEDGTQSSTEFEVVAPKVPDGFESSGWTYFAGRGDQNGWQYATTFAGPWYNDKKGVSMVRRRKWIALCRRKQEGESPRGIEF